jgi:MFS family permease
MTAAEQSRRADLGLMPWAMWGIAALFYCYAWLHRVSPGVMVAELMRDFAVGAAILGNMAAFYYYAYAGLQLPIGVLVDRFGPRRLVIWSCLATGTGSALFAAANDISVAYVGRLLIGMGAGFSFVCALQLAANWFPSSRAALLSGLTGATGVIGGVLGQTPLAALVDAAGWRSALWGGAALAAAITLLAWLFLRDRPSGREDARPNGNAAAGLLSGLKRATSSRQTWLLALTCFFMGAPVLALGGLWGVPYLMTVYGLDRPAAATIMAVMLIGWGVGAPLAGTISDRLGRRKLPMVVGAAVSMASLVAVLYAPRLPVTVAAILLFSVGLFASAMLISFAAAREHNPLWASGAALGLVNAVNMSSGAVFSPLLGILLDLGWDGTLGNGVRVYSAETYRTAFLALPACLAAAIVTTSLSRETGARQLVRE